VSDGAVGGRGRAGFVINTNEGVGDVVGEVAVFERRFGTFAVDNLSFPCQSVEVGVCKERVVSTLNEKGFFVFGDVVESCWKSALVKA
jgi:hypothetical protein